MSPRILIFGAGNIGRAFIGQVFSKNGYELVFADIRTDIIEKLNARGSYPVVIRQNNVPDDSITVSPVRAVSVLDIKAVTEEILNADILATSVGMNAIAHIAPLIAKGLMKRKAAGEGPVDLILAENIHDGKRLLLGELKKYVPFDMDIEKMLGIVQTSIGKMVPIVTEKDKMVDPLIVVSEPYNELIVDSLGFLNSIPEFPEISAVEPIEAFADRKIYVHNLGHAVTAYLGFQSYPDEKYIADILEHEEVRLNIQSAMEESARALLLMYPDTFDAVSLQEHIYDLLRRFGNKALGDTVFRVGRDLERKLNREDRLLGAIRNCEANFLPWEKIGRAFLAAFDFQACGEEGELSEQDLKFCKAVNSSTDSFIKLCGLNEGDPVDCRIITQITLKLQNNT